MWLFKAQFRQPNKKTYVYIRILQLHIHETFDLTTIGKLMILATNSKRSKVTEVKVKEAILIIITHLIPQHSRFLRHTLWLKVTQTKVLEAISSIITLKIV